MTKNLIADEIEEIRETCDHQFKDELCDQAKRYAILRGKIMGLSNNKYVVFPTHKLINFIKELENGDAG